MEKIRGKRVNYSGANNEWEPVELNTTKSYKFILRTENQSAVPRFLQEYSEYEKTVIRNRVES